MKNNQEYYFFSKFGFIIDDIFYINFNARCGRAEIKDRYVMDNNLCYKVTGENYIEFTLDISNGVLFKLDQFNKYRGFWYLKEAHKIIIKDGRRTAKERRKIHKLYEKSCKYSSKYDYLLDRQIEKLEKNVNNLLKITEIYKKQSC